MEQVQLLWWRQPCSRKLVIRFRQCLADIVYYSAGAGRRVAGAALLAPVVAIGLLSSQVNVILNALFDAVLTGPGRRGAGAHAVRAA